MLKKGFRAQGHKVWNEENVVLDPHTKFEDNLSKNNGRRGQKRQKWC